MMGRSPASAEGPHNASSAPVHARPAAAAAASAPSKRPASGEAAVVVVVVVVVALVAVVVVAAAAVVAVAALVAGSGPRIPTAQGLASASHGRGLRLFAPTV
jgi:hypothetical protein